MPRRLVLLLSILLAGCGPSGGGAHEAVSRAASPPPESTSAPARPSSRGRRARCPLEDGLKWLKSHQAPDGSWGDPYTTSIALHAFHRLGYTNRGHHPFARSVSKGLRHLKKRDHALRLDGREDLDLAVTASALSTAHAMTGSLIWRGVVQSDLDELARRARAGTLYNEEAVGWTLIALLEARGANHGCVRNGRLPPLVLDEDSFGRLAGWGDTPADASTRRLAVALLARVAWDPLGRGRAYVDEIAAAIAKRGDASDLAAAALTGWAMPFPSGTHARTWGRAFEGLRKSQVLDGELRTVKGSWDPETLPAYGMGRVRLTAYGCLIWTMRTTPCFPPSLEDVR